MATYPHSAHHGVPYHHPLLLVLLITLLSGCSASTMTSASHPSGPTPTATHGLKGTISEFPLPTSSSPFNITAGPDGNLWFTEISSDKGLGEIGRITPVGKISEFPLPAPQCAPISITTGPDGALWFTVSSCSKIGCKIGRLA